VHSKRKFGVLLGVTILLALSLFLVLQTDILTHTHLFVEGEGEEQIENVIDAFEDGSRFVILERTERAAFNHLLDRVFDSPYLFWVDMQYNALSVGNVSFLALREKYPDIDAAQKEIENVSTGIIESVITQGMTEYEKVLAIHDWLCENITYGESPDDSDQDIYGALVLRKARCAGYAKAFTYLLDKVGIRSEVISGDSLDKSGNSVAHAWNLVYIDGEPYYFDVTWDDEADKITYDWFGITSAEFRMTHFPSAGYEWVEATSTEACYYIKNKMYIDEYSYANIVRLIAQQGKSFYVKCANREVMNETIQAFNDSTQVQKIMRETGIKYISQIIYEEDKNSNCLYVRIT